MSEPIEENYFDWLRAKVSSSIHSQNHYDLLHILYRTEFVWFVPGDRNRAEDGKELRQHFLSETGWENDPYWFNEPCSVFEVFISFAKRASFQTDDPVSDWFWIFMTNLHLDEYYRVSKPDALVIDEILYAFVWRTYDENGYGGIFPMRCPENDQRKVEIWYQFCEYVDDQGLM